MVLASSSDFLIDQPEQQQPKKLQQGQKRGSLGISVTQNMLLILSLRSQLIQITSQAFRSEEVPWKCRLGL